MDSVIHQTLYIIKLLCTRMLPILFIITFLQEKGVFNKLDHIAQWIIKRTGFSSITGQAFIANIGSVYAGSGILVNMYKDKQISRSYLILSVIFAGFPAHLRIMLSSTGPVVFSLFTFPVALFYICFSLTDAILKLFIAGILSLILSSKKNSLNFKYTGNNELSSITVPKSAYDAFQSAIKRTLYYAWHIIAFVSLITLLVFALEHVGFFRMLPISVTIIGLPEEFNTALFSYMGNAYAGMGVLASFLLHNKADTLTGIKLLIFCMMCSRPIVMIKESPSYYFGLYGPSNGILLILFHLGVFLPLSVFALWIISIIN